MHCNSTNRNHQLQKLAENVKELPTPINNIIKKDISTNKNGNVLIENNHILENKNHSNLNIRENLLKNDKQIKTNKSRISDLTVLLMMLLAVTTLMSHRAL